MHHAWAVLKVCVGAARQGKERDKSTRTGVVTTSIVVGGVFLARDQLLGVKELAVGARADLRRGDGSQKNCEKMKPQRGGKEPTSAPRQ